MSTLVKSADGATVPATPYADRLFARFNALYGVQKVGAMFADGVQRSPEGLLAHMASIKAVWEEQITRFPNETLRAAMQALVDRGGEWPPSCPEFVALCRDFRRPEAAGPHLALPGFGQGYTDRDTAKRLLAELGLMVKRFPRPNLGGYVPAVQRRA